MRVVAGTAKGKKLLSVSDKGTRPILDRVKTALFDILRPKIENIYLLDLFAGTGAVGIEALSQGAKHCTFLDLSQEAYSVIKKNLENCNFLDRSEVRNTDSFRYLKNTAKEFDLIYIAPPQYLNLWQEAMLCIAERPNLLKNSGQIIVQIDPKEYETLNLMQIKEVRQKKYGNTLLVFYEKCSE